MFESIGVYKVDSQNVYLLLFSTRTNATNSNVYGFTSADLNGPWEALANSDAKPFSSFDNIEWPEGGWAKTIFDGELVRSGFDESQTIDPCNLEFFFEGELDTGNTSSFSPNPKELGLLKIQPKD